MNSHLNVFKTYTRENRNFQLENDLTRAFAICLQEDNLFFYEVLMQIFANTNYFNTFFENTENNTTISIDIQKPVSQIDGFEKVFAISLSESEMIPEHFWQQTLETKYDPVCDIVVQINDATIIFEAKRNAVNCTAQLYNQVFNIFKPEGLTKEELRERVIPYDLNWPKLMDIAVKVNNFEKVTGNPNRFLTDFIQLVNRHNFRWLPEPPIASLNADNTDSIRRRIESTLEELCKSERFTCLNNRLGLEFNQAWAKEMLLKVETDGSLSITVYAGNTKAQGVHIFNNEPEFRSSLFICGYRYEIEQNFHVKFTSFQKYFSGLWFDKNILDEPLYTKDNFRNYTGRNYRGEHWNAIEALFDRSFRKDFNWRNECNWDSMVINSGKSQFDLSFGYELSVTIPFNILKGIDIQKRDLTGLQTLLKECYTEFTQILQPE